MRYNLNGCDNMNQTFRDNLRDTLRKYILGNKDVKIRLMQELNISESAIKGWISPKSTNIPAADDIPVICSILDISFYELYGINNPTDLSEKELALLKAYNTHQTEQAIIDKILDLKNE